MPSDRRRCPFRFQVTSNRIPAIPQFSEKMGIRFANPADLKADIQTVSPLQKIPAIGAAVLFSLLVAFKALPRWRKEGS